MMVRTIFYL